MKRNEHESELRYLYGMACKQENVTVALEILSLCGDLENIRNPLQVLDGLKPVHIPEKTNEQVEGRAT